MNRKEALKLMKHFLLVMLTAVPLLIVLNLFCFASLNNNALVIFLDVVIGLAWVVVIEVIIAKIKRVRDKNKEINKDGK